MPTMYLYINDQFVCSSLALVWGIEYKSDKNTLQHLPKWIHPNIQDQPPSIMI